MIGLWAIGGRSSAIGQEQGQGQGGASGEALTARGVAFLKGRQEDAGGWSSEISPGITGLVVTALLRTGVTPFDPAVEKGLALIEQTIGRDGSEAEGPHANYLTAIGIMALNEAKKKGAGDRYDATIAGGQSALIGLQWDEGEGKTPADPFYGGAGYGSKSRPDMSNTSFMIEALRETGLPEDDPALQKALLFVSRSQNLDSEFNDQPFAGKVNDGGFIYTPANGGESQAGDAPGGGLRSYASMTYAGLKSMVYAGLTMDDPRVKAAYEFIRQNYSLDENPGMGQQGLFYYYQTFSKALAALGDPTLTDAEGREHDWRADLVAALADRQGPRGEWVNPADRWMEGDPNLVTAYALLALASARSDSGPRA
ncbi:prenyltransferase/squalene oxidase repeat-containing protein [Tautonia sp. JC769]|uniref:prenyltransferase/squalene oxidase repeat-containing protein n=1 Tax=Tautonia sp. JC769 TaxID=3232135 RepID=UPI00345851DA